MINKLPTLLFAFSIFNFLPVISEAQLSARAEFRGVWIASVTNIDWPESDTLSSSDQKTSFIRLLDMHKQNGMNAVIVQVRPSSDAFYPSAFEPWSEWLTGKQSLPPEPYYDPLEFMITETHKRGMEFHAWLNPYRAVFNAGSSSISKLHITRLHPEWFLDYGDKKYFDPGVPEARQYVTLVIRDIVHRYAVDAIHLDDYFYPYRITGRDFPDQESYNRSGKTLSRDDWRRSNVDSIIKMISSAIRSENNKCQFGISPFGVWRNADKDPVHGSKTRAFNSNYDDLYADILLWLKNDWIDYVAPQIYWETSHKLAPFDLLVDWWGEHSYGKKCYIGIGMYKAGTTAAWRNKNELPNQIKKIRSTPNVQGMIFYSSKSFMNNPNGWSDSLRLNYFKDPALLPVVR
jgi:uncharacterized lipoprotein YddW (UPF0748 family)